MALGLLAAAGMRAAADDPKGKEGARIRISGQVLDPDGRPAPGAKVYLGPLVDAKAMQWPRATTGPDGRFTVSVARPELRFLLSPDDAERMVQVFAEADGFGPAWTDPGEGISGRPVVLRLERDDVPIEGTIADLEGRPAAGAKVRPMQLATGVPRGLDAFLESYRASPFVTAYNPQLFRVLQTRAPSWPKEILTDEQGRFRLTGVGRERMVDMEVEGPSIEKLTIHVLTRRDVDLSRTDRSSPRYRMLYEGGLNVPVFYGSRFHHLANPSRPIEGTITDRDTGRPIAGVEVRGFAINHETSAKAQTGADGRFRLLGLPTEGKIRINALPGKGQPYLRQSVERRFSSSEPASVRMDLGLARGVLFRGRLIDGATRKGIGGRVEYMPYADNPHLARFPQLGADATGSPVQPDGTFELVALPGPGVVAAMAWEQSYRMSRPEQWGHPTDQGGYYATANRGLVRAEEFHAAARIDPQPGAAALRGELVLEPGLSVGGRLVDPDGRPVTGATTSGLRNYVGGIPVQTTLLDDAEFTAIGLDPASPRIVWFLNKPRTLGAAVVLPGPGAGPGRGPITVTLQPCGTLLGRMLDADGQPKRNVEVMAMIQHESLRSGGFGADVARTDVDGRFRITGLIAGVTYRLSGLDVPRMAAMDITLRIGEVRDLGDLKD
jgi:hypothetical protein